MTTLDPVMTYAFKCGKIPGSTEWKYVHMFDVKKRLEATWETVSTQSENLGA